MVKRALLFVSIALVAVGAFFLWAERRIDTPFRGFSGDEVFVEVPPGASVTGIAAKLATAGVVPDVVTFRFAAHREDAERRLQAGEYRFAEAATPVEIVRRIVRGDVWARPLTFPEGLTVNEMAAIFERSGLGRAADFRTAAQDGAAIAAFDPEAETLEGYLFPDTYALPRHAGAAGTIDAMVARFAQAFDADLRSAAEAAHLTTHDVVTLASLIEKETASADERPLVSAVYYNRLKLGMPLQCDPTVIYALMRAGRWRGNLTRDDLQMSSPYNTYRNAGLPPGPIASPGRASIEAAIRPADVPYLYFVSRNDGTHVFARSLAEHNRNVAEWQVKYFKQKH